MFTVKLSGAFCLRVWRIAIKAIVINRLAGTLGSFSRDDGEAHAKHVANIGHEALVR
jgi:hypothetical protein